MKNFALTISVLLFSVAACGQKFDFFTEEAYLRYPNHIEFGIGASNFLGDLGGKDAVGTNDFRDLEITEFNMAAYIGLRHAFMKNLYGRVNFNYGRVSGDDKLTKEAYRRNRNLNFRSNIFELDMMAEFWIRIGAKKGHQYKLSRKDAEGSPWRVRGSYFTAFAGIGIFHFNPKTELRGTWVSLYPLGTEGQGMPNGPKQYNLWQFNVPIGFSYMVRLHRQFSFGFEATYRYTFTDYIDDVSTSYYNPTDIALYQGEKNGEVAAYLSNPSLGEQNGGLPDYVTAPGQQRGDHTDNDGYFFAMLKVDYLIISEPKFYKKKTRRAAGNVRKHRKVKRVTI
ncbi:MAG: DUF6089 family protein [Flavobacteriales bacterium]